jgi:hypothetical protein
MNNLRIIDIADEAVELCVSGTQLDMPKFVQTFGALLIKDAVKIIEQTDSIPEAVDTLKKQYGIEK